MRIGLLGGTFNPIHNAHLRIALEARKACSLDKVVFIPAADPPHKPLAGDVSFEHRSAMVALAIAEKPAFEMSTVEAEREGKSYSIDTIMEFRKRLPDDELFFIIGGDSFLEIGTWHRYPEIFIQCNIIVVERPGCRIAKPFTLLPEAVSPDVLENESEGSLTHLSGKRLFFLEGTPQPVSSTEIRGLAAAGDAIISHVPPEVAAYISQRRIYSQCQQKRP